MDHHHRHHHHHHHHQQQQQQQQQHFSIKCAFHIDLPKFYQRTSSASYQAKKNVEAVFIRTSSLGNP